MFLLLNISLTKGYLIENSNLLIHISLQPGGVDFRYLKLGILLDQTIFV